MAGSLLAHFTKKNLSCSISNSLRLHLEASGILTEPSSFFPRLYIPPSICTVNVSVFLITAIVRKYDSIPDLMPRASYAEDLFLVQ